MAPLSLDDESIIESRIKFDWTSSPTMIVSVSTIFVFSLFLILILCCCGKNDKIEAPVDVDEVEKKAKKGKKGSKKKTSVMVDDVAASEKAEEPENDEEEEAEADDEEKEESQTTSKAKTVAIVDLHKKRGSKPKKGGKKIAAAKKKIKNEETADESAIGGSQVEDLVTRAPSVNTEIFSTKPAPKKKGKGKPAQPKRSDPLYRTLMGADSQVFDRKPTKKVKHTAKGDACYIKLGDKTGRTKTGGPCMPLASMVEPDEQTEMQNTIANAKSNVFDRRMGQTMAQERTIKPDGNTTRK